ncbi:hypothetical protein QTJ16_003608 [Diplocarpon rosae]|uniref:glycerophosphodiester phosphodiesterase n=1 Tax=Diplocarpon rosae TaxID=946125 RepID=A0AAD9WDS1_9HELO|nr:hypothetical protein QTJ16_003608 [Diplocarpon rosae]PBP22125.1 glycerophosphoryl diester phosphodiesterase family protein [Diplocarpon rosae]
MLASLLKWAVAALAIHTAAALPSKPPQDIDQDPVVPEYKVSYDPRPFYLINNMTESPLKKKLQSCENDAWSVTGFSIGHRGGGTLQFPEGTVESVMAGAKMGAGIFECDVVFTADRGLVCRHSTCDLHTSTDILLRPELAAKCTIPFRPAKGYLPAEALCCTSDITIDEFTSLCGKPNGFNRWASNVHDYLRATPSWGTDLYATCGTLMTLDSFITLVDSLPGHRNFTPELKTPDSSIVMPFNGYTQEQYARDMLEKFIERGISPDRVWPQSFLLADIEQWITEYPDFAKQAVFLDEDGDMPEGMEEDIARLQSLKDKGINIIAPPFGYLLSIADDHQTIIPSDYAIRAKEVGLDIIAWTYEGSGPLATVKKREEYYFSFIEDAVHTDGQIYEILDVLARQVGIKALFSDWSSTVSYYANCFGFEYGGVHTAGEIQGDGTIGNE